MNLVHDLFTSRTANRWIPRVAVLLLVIGVIAFAAVKWSNTAKSINTGVSNQPASMPKPEPPTTKVSPEARRVAAQFIHTAVARKNLAQAWKITGGILKEGTTYKQWLSGNIAVVPYPAAKNAGMQVSYSHANAAELIFALLPRKGVHVKPQYFMMDLARVGRPDHKHWIVTYWAPRSPPQVPAPPDQ
jgi:hypothetical protein